MRTDPERGAAILVVLLAIVVLLLPTMVLMSLAFRWQRQAIDFRDLTGSEQAAWAGFEEARLRLSGNDLRLEPGEASVFARELPEGLRASVRVERMDDVVLTLEGRMLDSVAARQVDLEHVGVDPEGRTVYQYRKLAMYLVRSEVRRRPTLPVARLYGVVAELPDDGGLEVLGLDVRRVFDDAAPRGTDAPFGSGKAEP